MVCSGCFSGPSAAVGGGGADMEVYGRTVLQQPPNS